MEVTLYWGLLWVQEQIKSMKIMTRYHETDMDFIYLEQTYINLLLGMA